MPPPFEIIEHPADIGFLAYGATPNELFQNAALALISLACSPEGIEEREQREITAHGAAIDSLLYAWLAEILAVADAEQLVFRRVEVKHLKLRDGEKGRLEEVAAVAYGEKFDRARHTAGTYIKAVTYHQFRIECNADGWRAQVFLDL
ncbi:MAG: archease [Candidatus Acidiferrales bacterium]